MRAMITKNQDIIIHPAMPLTLAKQIFEDMRRSCMTIKNYSYAFVSHTADTYRLEVV